MPSPGAYGFEPQLLLEAAATRHQDENLVVHDVWSWSIELSAPFPHVIQQDSDLPQLQFAVYHRQIPFLPIVLQVQHRFDVLMLFQCEKNVSPWDAPRSNDQTIIIPHWQCSASPSTPEGPATA